MMLVPRRNSFDLFDDFIEDEFFPRNSFFSKRERNLMKTDIKEKKDKYILDIDLPGFKRKIIPFDIPKNTEEYPIQIAKNYIKNPLNILLCVIPATLMNCSLYDEFALFGLKLISEMSPLSEYPNNLRKLGVLTKIEIMDVNTDVRNFY